jgi:hypothetical protein
MTIGLAEPTRGLIFWHTVFHQLLSQARGHGLVKDRLRIKDATHVLADIAIPAGLQLIAQARNKLLTAAERFAARSIQMPGAAGMVNFTTAILST